MILAVAILVFVAILLIRAAMYKPKAARVPSKETVVLNEEKIVQNMQEMIRCKTISYNEENLIDKREFEKFQNLLPKLYPTVHKVCEWKFLGVNGILYHWKGRTAHEPIVLMSHYDVVPVEEEQSYQ